MLGIGLQSKVLRSLILPGMRGVSNKEDWKLRTGIYWKSSEAPTSIINMSRGIICILEILLAASQIQIGTRDCMKLLMTSSFGTCSTDVIQKEKR